MASTQLLAAISMTDKIRGLKPETFRPSRDEGLELGQHSERIHKQTAPQPILSRFPITLVHGHWANMGGYAFSTINTTPLIPPLRERSTLTPKGIILLLENAPGLFPDISEAEILDKSKQSGLAKFVTCITACLFILRCASRIYARLPLSLLELNTFAHTLCTLGTYWMWWNKPLDAMEPTLIVGEEMRSLYAYMWVCSQEGYFDCSTAIKKLANQAKTQYPELPEININYNAGYLTTRIPDTMGNWKALEEVGQYRRLLALVSVTTLYGGFHALAYNAPFSTSLERNLWRCASFAIIAIGFTVAGWVLLLKLRDWFCGSLSDESIKVVARLVAALQ